MNGQTSGQFVYRNVRRTSFPRWSAMLHLLARLVGEGEVWCRLRRVEGEAGRSGRLPPVTVTEAAAPCSCSWPPATSAS